MHIVIVVDSYFPNYSMNGIIANNLIELLKLGNTISVITYKNKYSDLDNVKVNGIEIFRLVNHNICLLNEINKKNIEELAFSKFVLQFSNKLRKVFFYIKRNIRLVGIDFGLSNRIKEELSRIRELSNIDVLITISAPFEIAYAGLQFAKQNSKVIFIPIQLDYFSDLVDSFYPKILRKYRVNTRMNFEDELIKESKAFFALDFLRNSISKRKLNEISNKVVYFEHPLVKMNDSESLSTITSNDNEFSLIYAGSLSKSERNPIDVFEILLLIKEEIDFKFHIMHRGDCDEIIMKYNNKMPGNIVNWGSVETSKSYSAIKSADILLSIGSKFGNQVAGKTFEYISTGKPVIYFYYNENDINKRYFDKYPLSLCLCVNNLSYSKCASQIKLFLLESKGKLVDFEYIEDQFKLATPKFIAELILDKINQGD